MRGGVFSGGAAFGGARDGHLQPHGKIQDESALSGQIQLFNKEGGLYLQGKAFDNMEFLNMEF